MRILLFFSILLFGLYACTPSPEAESEGEGQVLALPKKPAVGGYFNKHFEIAEVIPIQTTETFLVADIKKVIRHGDRIMLLSGKNNTVFIINASNGRVETHINRVGKGPGESRLILDIAYDEQSEQLIIYNDYSKLLFYDRQGQFISEMALGSDLYENIHGGNGEVLFHSKLAGYSHYPYVIDRFNIQDNTWKKAGKDGIVDFAVRLAGRKMVKSKRLWFAAPLDFKLFSYSEGQVGTPYELDIPKDAQLDDGLISISATDPMLFFNEVAKNDLVYSINSIRETNDYIVLRTNRGGLITINKQEETIHWDQYVEAKALSPSLAYFPHDGDDDKIMFILPAEAYLSHIRANPGSNGYAINVEELDNPILVFYKQKSLLDDSTKE